MKVLVTGGAGYVGSTLVQALLNQGHDVRVLDNLMYGGRALLNVWAHEAFEFHYGDICDIQVVQTAVSGMDVVVHLAAIVGDPACNARPKLAQATNLEASLHLLEAGKAAGLSRFIFASTCSNYGRMADPEQLVDEESELRPVSLYAKTKVTVEEVVLNSKQTAPLCTTSLRFATVFGVSPRMRFDLTVNEFTRDMLLKKYLRIYGKQFWRPYIHVFDVARAIMLVMAAPTAVVQNQVFNVGSSTQNYQKQQLVSMIHRYAPEATVEYVHKEEDPRDYRVSFAKIKSILNFDITRSVEDGIVEVAQLVQSGVLPDYEAPEYRN